jgi:hypothetical protein
MMFKFSNFGENKEIIKSTAKIVISSGFIICFQIDISKYLYFKGNRKENKNINA